MDLDAALTYAIDLSMILGAGYIGISFVLYMVKRWNELGNKQVAQPVNIPLNLKAAVPLELEIPLSANMESGIALAPERQELRTIEPGLATPELPSAPEIPKPQMAKADDQYFAAAELAESWERLPQSTASATQQEIGINDLTQAAQGRLLLSHNFDVADSAIPALSREEFATVFIEGLSDSAHCRLLNHPHWIVEVTFDPTQFAAAQIGDQIAQALVAKRRQLTDVSLPQILILAGNKTTPATSDAPDALQPGDWGVDVVETSDSNQFLQSIGWEAAIAAKPPQTTFKIELKA